MSHFFVFPAVRGVQAGREYYVSMCPLRLIPRLFLLDEENLSAEERSQRSLNKNRVPIIAKYVVDNPDTYVFSAITASVDAEVTFDPLPSEDSFNMGWLKVPMTARFLINDGQHRRAAVEMALKRRPELGSETIAVVFFVDTGLMRAQQMFADLNRYAIRPTPSLSILYDHRDKKAELTKEIVSRVNVFSGLTELDKSTISNRERKLFTLSAIYRATKELLANGQTADADGDLAVAFWNGVSERIEAWNRVKAGKMSPADSRQRFVHSHAIALVALGQTGRVLMAAFPQDWESRLDGLRDIDWERTNPYWEGRVAIAGKISFSRNNLSLLTAALKQKLGVPLTPEEITAESKLQEGGLL